MSDNFSLEAAKVLSEFDKDAFEKLLEVGKAFNNWIDATWRPVVVKVLVSIDPKRDWDEVSSVELLSAANKVGGFNNLVCLLGFKRRPQKNKN